MEFKGLTSASHMSLPEAGYGSEEGYVGSEISGAVSGVTTPGASRLQASQLQQRSTTMQRLHAPDPDSQPAMEKVATAKVKAWRKAGQKEKEKEPMKVYPMFGTTWGEGFEAPYEEMSAAMSNDSSEWEADWISREPTPSLPSKPRPPSPRGVCPEPVRVERGLPSRMAAPKLGLDETMELLSRVLGAGDEDPDFECTVCSTQG